MSNVEHLFENAISALEDNIEYEDWLELEVERGNATLGFKEMKTIWVLAQYVVYTYKPTLKYNSEVIPIEWLEKWVEALYNDNRLSDEEYGCYISCYLKLKWDWEKENERMDNR